MEEIYLRNEDVNNVAKAIVEKSCIRQLKQTVIFFCFKTKRMNARTASGKKNKKSIYLLKKLYLE